MKKLTEHTYGDSIFMRIELDGIIEEISCYPGADCSWEHYRTSGDGDEKRREQIIDAFNALY